MIKYLINMMISFVSEINVNYYNFIAPWKGGRIVLYIEVVETSFI